MKRGLVILALLLPTAAFSDEAALSDDAFENTPEEVQESSSQFEEAPVPAPVPVPSAANSRAATTGAVIEHPPGEVPTVQYQPDWSRYTKGGLFGDLGPGPTSSDETPDVAVAEAHFLTLLNMEIPPGQRRQALLDLADIYQRYNVKPKVIATYERFVEAFPQDPMVPELYMRLGFLYREIGAFRMSLNKFYSVLNASLAISRDSMETYKLLSLKAQVEIADTYYVMGDYDNAAKFYLRLKRLDFAAGDRAIIDFKYAYSHYLLERFPTVVTSLKAFIKTFPEHPLVPESHFLLATAYKKLNEPRAALEAVLTLLQTQQRTSDQLTWTYWKKRTGNQLANDFYEQGDYASALAVYQAMVVLSDDPEWQWPVVYQIGLCFERLRMVPKSVEAYELILRGAETVVREGRALPVSLQELSTQAKWRLEHLQWLNGTEAELNRLLGPAPLTNAGTL